MTALSAPAGAFRLPAELYAHDIAQYCPSGDYPVVRAVLKDATPVDGEGAYLLCHRPVRETGSGYGDGFNLGFELTCVAVALSNLVHEVTDGRKTWGDFTADGITEAMVQEARTALYDARDAWDAQRAEQCATGFVCVELARYSTDGTIAARLVCACGCSHEPRRMFYNVTGFEAAESDRRLAANLERWGMQLTGPFADFQYETNWFGTTRRAPVAPVGNTV
ncbi:hypothetical protein OG883_44125 [Streptomyces sp. NBC_01142]|uniref:hypothetical protein n=1 Tax=Streptomyces sp. NBC_01142 TaxID=2975865 RepID=UPI0022591501|nr:hypothetical protein [Streptomyces sp. NBC_01142]MCX4826631.1 hypothetical protein [Streptomyces sp. NBC_01142]